MKERQGEGKTTPSSPDHPQSSSTTEGTWGEERRGEQVNVQRAKQEFFREVERVNTNHSQNRLSFRPDLDLEQQVGGDPSQDFDLGEWILNRRQKATSQGLELDKPVGLLWSDVDVYVPTSSSASDKHGGGGGDDDHHARVMVKTLPTAILNTFTRDPISILASLVPRRLAKPAIGKRFLVSRLSGVLKPGEMLLVLGRPGSGCSTALRAITSSDHTNVEVDGNLLYGGLSKDEVVRKFRGEVIHCDEEDNHFPTLTVAQTLSFALSNKVPSKRSRLKGESASDFVQIAVDVLLKMFGISHVRNTIVGDSSVRGVSGGERKRVTISEALSTQASVIAWDNSTRGLDASTALDYARSLRIMTDLASKSTIATLYQVSESIFELFDRVSVMDQGRCIYYGPRDRVRRYFYDLGYECPQRQTTADFVTALTDPDLVTFRKGFEGSAPKTSEEREAIWRQSPLFADLMSEMEAYEERLARSKQEAEVLKTRVRSGKNRGVNKGSSYTVNYLTQVRTCIHRQLLVKWGARGDLYVKLFTIVGVSLMISSLFYGQSFDSTGVFTRGGVLLFACLFNGWLQLSESFEAVAGRPMLSRHKQFAFYRPSAVVVARALVDIPFLLVQCFISSIIIYFLSNLRRDAGAFWIFYSFTFLSAYSLTALYRMCAAFSPGFNEAIRFSVLCLNVLVIWVGYVLRRPQMNWLVWLNYAQPISYAFEALLSNELDYAIPCTPSQIVPFNEQRDVAFQTCSLTGGQPGSLVVPSADYLSTTFGYSRSNIGRNAGVVIAFSILYLIPTIIGSEIMDFGGSGGGVTVYAKSRSKRSAIRPRQASSQLADEDTNGEAKQQQQQNDRQVEQQLGGRDSIDQRPIFTWKDVNLQLDSGRKLLENIDGYVKPGSLTALMGASGAGKTTLLTTLSQRAVAGTVSGEILVDGKPLGQGFQRGTGFVLQSDVHLASQTVKEAIEFSALLRQPAEVAEEQKLEDARRVMELLELTDLEDALIGVPGFGLGVERRKRVTIAVELAAKPDLLLFLDEPTSGLDSAGAASIIRLLRRLADEGQAILCTIHQPSSLLFESFDNLLLLESGGRTCYFGQIGDERGQGSGRVRRYFERNGAPACSPSANVAEYVLETVAGGGKGLDGGKGWGERWRSSPECRLLREEVERLNSERSVRPAALEDPRAGREFSASNWTQIKVVTKRQFKDLWRDSPFAYGVLFSNLVTGMAAGGGFAHLGSSTTDLQYRVFVVFLVMLNFPAMVNSIISKFWEMRITFQVREGPSKTYSWWSMMTALVAVSIPIALVASVLFFLPCFFLPLYSEPSTKAIYFWLQTLNINLYEVFFSLALAAACPTPVQAANLLPFILPILAIVNGVIVPYSSMPAPWSGVYWTNPISYYVQGQVANLLHSLPVTCNDADLAKFYAPPGQTCQDYAGEWAESTGGYLVQATTATATPGQSCGYCQYGVGDQFASVLSSEWASRWRNFGVVTAYVVFQLAAAFFCYWYFTEKGRGIGLGWVRAKYLIMLIAMSFNGYMLISIVLGGLLGHFFSTWDTLGSFVEEEEEEEEEGPSMLEGPSEQDAYHPVGVDREMSTSISSSQESNKRKETKTTLLIKRDVHAGDIYGTGSCCG
ncbi:hypothetical protein IE53DRAFT_405048 [Violaceomyces palustris]|uniref:Uncharacterized protein n=1 Tax=Violaceomyces palustris TaxID=1673888 RepID=A0ACD0P3B8_9BASI|nr:hypothetical protein IE53DRAFT_405048 [Violaceomyces palustris]